MLVPDPPATSVGRREGASRSEWADNQIFTGTPYPARPAPAKPILGNFPADGPCFGRRFAFKQGDSTLSEGLIGLYLRACDVLECKQTGLGLAPRLNDRRCLPG